MADLRGAFTGIMRKWGHNVLLQRCILGKRTGIYGVGENNGFAKKFERYTVRHRYPSTALASVSHEMPEGITHKVDMIYYFPYEASPKEGDRILERDDRFQRATDTVGTETFIIDFALPMKGWGGRVEYWMVGATRETPN